MPSMAHAEEGIKKLALGIKTADRVAVPEATLSEALALYDSARYVDACRVALTAGPLQHWRGAPALVFGSRLAGNVGAPRLSALLISRAFREAPDSPEAAVHYSYHLGLRRGPLAAWRCALRAEGQPGMAPHFLADLKAHRAVIAAGYRDFATAWRLWDEAHALEPDNPWVFVEKAAVLSCQERRLEALEAIDYSLALHPWFRSAVQQRARLLHLLGRWDEAIAFLAEANQHIQSYAVAMQLLSLKREVDDHAGMAAVAELIQTLAVLQEPSEQRWMQSWLADILYLKGDFHGAADLAATLPGRYYPAFAARLRDPAAPRTRKRLTFEFVHQKHNTCAPATLAAIAHFWKRPITMEQIVDAICYDGTYDYSARTWGESNGFAVREFTVTLPAARGLIDAGIPFVLNTVEVASAHAQAVIGYDHLRETLFIQDPSEPHFREVPAEEFLSNYKLTGPHGLALVPEEETERLKDLHLPESDLYDQNYRFSKALAAYDRGLAAEALGSMEAIDATHRLVLLARMSLAQFDGNDVAHADCIDGLLVMFPEDQRLLHWKVMALRTLGNREERLLLLRAALRTESAHPWFMRALGEELMGDARDWPEARRRLWRAHAANPREAAGLVRLAELIRRSDKEPEPDLLNYYRFAAAASDKTEGFAQLWFNFAISQGQIEEALDWLRRRQREYGAKSSAPALTLAQALDVLGRTEVVDVVREAVAQHPDDGEALIYLATMEARLGFFDAADDLLSRARGKTAPGPWLRARASLLRRRGDHVAEQQVWHQILDSEPLALDAHESVARELAATRGSAAAAAYFEAACERYPHHYGLAQLLASWLRETNPTRAEAHAQHMTELHPNDPWAYRELALTQRSRGRHQEALVSARTAVTLAPDQAPNHTILGLALLSANQKEESIGSLRSAVRLNVNFAASYEGLMAAAEDTAQQRRELAFIRGEMVRQVLDGNGLHAYRAHAFGVLPPDELLAELRELWEARPDLWEAWSVLIAQLLDSGAREEALALATEASVRFALTPGAWRDLATVQRLTGDKEGAVQTAQKVVQMNPDWSDGWVQLAEYLDDAGHTTEAISALRRAMVRLPLAMPLRRNLAMLLWGAGERDEAWSLALKSAQQDPSQDWAWGCMQNWADPLQKQDDLISVARMLTATRSEEPRSWFVLARLLPAARLTEMLDALDRAVSLNPRMVDAYDHRAEILGRVGRIDEAAASLHRGPWTDAERPHVLRGRLAWLRAVRGDLPGAISDLRAVVDHHRDYYWGWEILATWAARLSDIQLWRAAAKEMIRLNPRSPTPYCTAADVEFHAGDHEEGIQHLRKALHVDPGSPYAVQRLLGFYWDKKDLANLAATAESLPTAGTAGLIRRTYLMLHAAHFDRHDQVREDLEFLATQPDMLGPLLSLMLEYFHKVKASFKPALDQVLAKVAANNSIGPAFAILWVHREAEKRNWHSWHQLARWLPRLGANLDPAIGTYLDQVGEARAGTPHVEHFIKECGPALRRSGELWGKVSYALANSGNFRACVDWQLPDYQRPDAEGWMLSNLAISLRAIHQADKAEQVSLHAVDTGIRDGSWTTHVAITAHGYARKRCYQEARDLLARESMDDAPPDWRLLALTARTLSEVMPLPPAQGRPQFRSFLSAAKSMLTRNPVPLQTQRDYESAVELMRKHTGAMLMPWQSVTPKPQQAPRKAAGSGVVLAFVFILLFNVLRSCENNSFTSSRESTDALLERVRTAQPRVDETRGSSQPLLLPPPSKLPIGPVAPSPFLRSPQPVYEQPSFSERFPTVRPTLATPATPKSSN